MLLLHRCLTFHQGNRVKISRRPSTAVARLLYHTLTAIFDALDVVLCWARPSDKKLEDSVNLILLLASP
jgi:hypothetical protein